MSSVSSRRFPWELDKRSSNLSMLSAPKISDIPHGSKRFGKSLSFQLFVQELQRLGVVGDLSDRVATCLSSWKHDTKRGTSKKIAPFHVAKIITSCEDQCN